MTNEYRMKALTDAQAKVDTFRRLFNQARTSKARRVAADELEFWTNKTAYLSAEGE